jgi:hypothetical protein
VAEKKLSTNHNRPLRSYHQFQQRLRCCRWLIDQTFLLLLLLLLTTMANTDISLTTFERRQKAAVIAFLAAIVSPFYGALFAGVYALVEVTLTALVRPRTWPLRLLGTSMVVSSFLLLQKHTCSWAGYLPAIVYVFLSRRANNHERAVGRWRSGTDLVIARLVEQGPIPAHTYHRCSWSVFTDEDLDEDQLRTIERKFCGDCPEPRFQQPWNHRPVVDICLRSVQFWYSEEEGRLQQRVSEWRAPEWLQPVEFEYRASLPQRLDTFASDFLAVTSLVVAVPVAVYAETDFVREWGLMAPDAKVMLTTVVFPGLIWVIVTFGVPAGMVLERLWDVCIRNVNVSLTSLFESTRRRACNALSTTKRAFKAGVRGAKTAATWIRTGSARTSNTVTSAVRTIANGTNKALTWMRSRLSMVCDVIVNVGQAAATRLGQLLVVAWSCIVMSVELAGVATRMAILTAWFVIAALCMCRLIAWLCELESEVRSSAGSRLLQLWNVVTFASSSVLREISLQCVVRATGTASVGAARASTVAAAIVVAASAARAFVLTAKAARDGCVGLVASGYKERTLLRKARHAEAGRCCRSLKLVPKTHAGPSALVAAAWRDVVRLDAGEPKPQAKRGKLNLAEVREVAKRASLEQQTRENAANSACAKKGKAVPSTARRGGPRRTSVCTANASTTALRRSPRTRA